MAHGMKQLLRFYYESCRKHVTNFILELHNYCIHFNVQVCYFFSLIDLLK